MLRASAIGGIASAANFRLGLAGLATGFAVTCFWQTAHRRAWGGGMVVTATAWAAFVMNRHDHLPPAGRFLAAGLAVIAMGVVGATLQVRGQAGGPAGGWGWTAAGTVVSGGGVFLGVPETAPAVIVLGVVVALTASTAIAHAAWRPSFGGALALALGWASLTGAAGRPWAAVGGALCLGLAPWLALRRLLPAIGRGLPPGPWLLAVHAALVLAAARWIGVVPHAGWHRVLVVSAAGLATVLATAKTPAF